MVGREQGGFLSRQLWTWSSFMPVVASANVCFSASSCFNEKIPLQLENMLFADLKLCSSFSSGVWIHHTVLYITKTLISSLASVFPAKPWFFRPQSWIFSQWMLPWPWAWPWSSTWVHGAHDTNIRPDTLIVYYTLVTWSLQVSYINLLVIIKVLSITFDNAGIWHICSVNMYSMKRNSHSLWKNVMKGQKKLSNRFYSWFPEWYLLECSCKLRAWSLC